MATFTQKRVWFAESATHDWGVWTLSRGGFFGAVRDKVTGGDVFATPPVDSSAAAREAVETYLDSHPCSGTDRFIADARALSPEFDLGYSLEKAALDR